MACRPTDTDIEYHRVLLELCLLEDVDGGARARPSLGNASVYRRGQYLTFIALAGKMCLLP
jgi:hypothetical protein